MATRKSVRAFRFRSHRTCASSVATVRSGAVVLYKLDGGLDHILIDEGQDTSPAQWDLITPLENEFFAGRARERERTVFSVGDPKQSIYAFQGADPERFLAESQSLAKRAHAADKAVQGAELRTSFRSSPEILRAVDETMKRAAHGRPRRARRKRSPAGARERERRRRNVAR